MGEELDNSWFTDREKELEIEELLQEEVPETWPIHFLSTTSSIQTKHIAIQNGLLDLGDLVEDGDRLFTCTTSYKLQDFIDGIDPPPPAIVSATNPITVGVSIRGFSSLDCAIVLKKKPAPRNTRRKHLYNEKRTRKMNQRF